MDASERGLYTPMYRLVARPPCRPLIPTASRHAIGGFCIETGQYWRYDLSEEDLVHFCGRSKHLQLQDSISSNAPELLGMAMSAYMLAVVCGERPVGDRDYVLLQGDNGATVH